LQRWLPGAIWLPRYRWDESLVRDLLAALSVAALYIPESLGYASVAGLPVQVGLYAAPLALIAYALFGGSRLLVISVTGAGAAITATAIAAVGGGGSDAMTVAVALTLAAGGILLGAGLLRLGWIANFMSHAVMEGFITGMAIQIIIGQLHKIVGVAGVHGDSFEKLFSILQQWRHWAPTPTIVGVGAIVLIIGLERITERLPASLIAVVAGSIFVAMANPEIELVAKIPSGLPSLTFPSGFGLTAWATLFLASTAIALVAFSETWGVASSLARETHDDLDTDQEFRAIGVANLGAGLLGGMPVTGSLAKSTVARASGARTQMVAVILAIVTVLTLLFFAPAFQWLPEAVLAAVVIAAMRRPANPARLRTLWQVDRVGFALASITALIVLVAELLPALITGVVLSIIYLVYRVSFPAREALGRLPTGDFAVARRLYGRRDLGVNEDVEEIPGVIVYRFVAPLIFSNASAFVGSARDLLIGAAQRDDMPHTFVADFEQIIRVDETGLDAIDRLIDDMDRYGVDLRFARVHMAVRDAMKRAGVMDRIPADHLHRRVRQAVDAALRAHPAGTGETDTGT